MFGLPHFPLTLLFMKSKGANLCKSMSDHIKQQFLILVFNFLSLLGPHVLVIFYHLLIFFILCGLLHVI